MDKDFIIDDEKILCYCRKRKCWCCDADIFGRCLLNTCDKKKSPPSILGKRAEQIIIDEDV